MKKLNLNKKVIAQLNNPENIQGGATVTYGKTGMDVAAISKYFDAEKGGNCESGQYEACLPTQLWHCPSNRDSYCYLL